MLTFKEFRDAGDPRNDDKALEVVRKGMNLDGEDFWSNFLSLCGQADGMAALLGVPREKITALHGRVNEMIDRVGTTDKTKSKDRLIKTGKK